MDKIGRYEIRQELGRGGMATVLLAHDPHFKRDVAIKLLPREFLHDESFRARFTREAQTIASLEHPAIVPVYDFGEENGQPYIVMRFMSGGSLADRIDQGPIPVKKAAQILGRIGAALDHAHGAGVIHRDLKPGNILFDQLENSYLADFGIARLAQATTTITKSSAIIGTPAYMSPEQVHGDKDVDERTDIYALGIIVFEMLTGQQPYQADTPAKVMMKHVLDPVPNIRQVKPDLPEASARIISTALAKDPEDRFTNASALSAEMLRLSEQETVVSEEVAATIIEPIPAEQPSPEPRLEIPTEPPSTAPSIPFGERLKRIPSAGKISIGLIGLVGLFLVLWLGGFFEAGSNVSQNEVPQLSPTSVAVASVPTSIPPTPTTATSALSQYAQEILDRGTIRIGTRSNSSLWPLSVISDGQFSGFEIDLAQAIVANLFSDSVRIEWVPLSATDRFTALQSGEIDILIRNTVHTQSREELGLWTSNYFLDGPRLAVRPGENYESIQDLDGETISVVAGTFTDLILSQTIEEAGLDINILRFDAFNDALDALMNGGSAAFFAYWTSLASISGEDITIEIVGDILTGSLDAATIGQDPFGIVVPNGQNDFRDEVDKVLLQLIEDGSWQVFYNGWFIDPLPWTIGEMLAAPPVER